MDVPRLMPDEMDHAEPTRTPSMSKQVESRERGGREDRPWSSSPLSCPIMLFPVADSMDLGRVFCAQIVVINAAHEAALEAARNPDSYIAGTDCDPQVNRVTCRALNTGKGGMYAVEPDDVAVSYDPFPLHATPILATR